MSNVVKIEGNPSQNYSPPIPPTRIPYRGLPDHFYVRFLKFSVFLCFAVCCWFFRGATHRFTNMCLGYGIFLKTYIRNYSSHGVLGRSL